MQHITITTSQLDIACRISGPEDGFPVILLHGWPDDALTWHRLLPDLHAAGFRTYVPWLRGCGPTRFREADIPRNGQLVALAQDVLEMADVVGISRFNIIGHDWGARTAYIASVLAPDRIAACVALSVGWGTNDAGQAMSYRQMQNYWYHWLMGLDRGAELIRNDRQKFMRYIWSIWNPGWQIPEAEFAATAQAFENPDWADITLHSYRVRWGLAERSPAFEDLEKRVVADPIIHVPTLVIHGDDDPCNDPETSASKGHLFRGYYKRHVLPGTGHFPQRQSANAVTELTIPFFLQNR
ncbi:alpha/beta fold hydrolase [Acetobacter sp. TBRC 12305]|uniref:Alpha/beta hydrolase n=1 Tax=Acetobacter garciniae TaxID=2817435 RepID=A0A939HMH6_9PROT|nr:alpha/beta hydrolase [Acetobacter garciniae]MBO1325635.1 alpha/beta hydrolase [Acetobacter garciniae]MBX0345534.1 alpha/beta fold hydrolase [Acetobacter garciniae]